jgi:hypothetical protein
MVIIATCRGRNERLSEFSSAEAAGRVSSIGPYYTEFDRDS